MGNYWELHKENIDKKKTNLSDTPKVSRDDTLDTVTSHNP